MSDPAPKNVVDMEAYGQLRRIPGSGPGTRILQDVRDSALESLRKHLGRMMEKTDDALFARAEKADNNSSQTQYFDAMREIRIIRRDIEEDFTATFSSQFNRGMRREPAGSSREIRIDWESDSGMSLVGAEQLEEDLAISNMVVKVRGTCTQSLFSLDKRIGFLIQDPDLERWHNPLGPEAICKAFRQASQRIETGIEIRLVIYKLFDQQVIWHLDQLYKDVNQRLVQAGVLPEIKTVVRKTINPGQPGGTHQAGQPVHENSATGSMEYSSNGPAGGHATNRQSVVSDGVQFTGISWPSVQPSISALTFLQQGSLPSDPITQMQVGVAPQPGELESGQVNVLRGFKGSPMIQELGKAGDMTIDIVAMLFDYILDDKSIPDTMRALIGRLQIPILKVSLLDREFFSRKSHPARRLLNRLASSGMGWNDEQGRDDPLYLKIASIVQTIIDKFEDDISLFETLLDDLEDFLGRDEEKAELRAERSAQVMEGQERLDIAKATTMKELEPRLGNDLDLDFVRDFVANKWKNLLFVTCARDGRESDAWKQNVATMDQLIWSIKPKTTPEDRARLVSLQPDLLRRLREGMERLSMPSTERDDFLARLVRAHGRTAVSKAPEPATATPEIASAEQSDEAVTVLSSQDEQAGGNTQEPATAAGDSMSTNAAPETEDSHTARARRLKSGDWLQFIDENGESNRAKLSWVSPITGTYLFTDRQGLKAGNFTVLELADLMRNGKAKTLNATPLMDRAVSTVLREYQKD